MLYVVSQGCNDGEVVLEDPLGLPLYHFLSWPDLKVVLVSGEEGLRYILKIIKCKVDVRIHGGGRVTDIELELL